MIIWGEGFSKVEAIKIFVRAHGFEIVVERVIMAPSVEQIMQHLSTKDSQWFIDRAQERNATRAHPRHMSRRQLKEYGVEILHKTCIHRASAPITVLLLSRKNGFETAKAIKGKTDPSHSPPGTIRGEIYPYDWSAPDSIARAEAECRAMYTMLHFSDNKRDALRETRILVPEWVKKYFSNRG
jgi:nucleoside diphosphate kinase